MRSKKAIALMLTVAALTVSGCGNKIDTAATFATLGDTTVTMGVANFLVKYQQANYDLYYMPYFGEGMWDTDMYGNGTTMSQDVKSNVAEDLQEMYLLQAHMGEYDITISEEEESAIAKAVDDFLAENSKKAIKQIGATNREDVETVLRLKTIQAKMHERIIQDANVEVTDEEAAQKALSYVEINTDGYYDDDNNYIEYEETQKESLKDTAAMIASAEDFDTAVTDNGYTVSTANYGSAADEGSVLDSAVLEEADKLKEGQVSGVIETESAYYVVRLDSEYDEEASATKKEELISQKQEEYYNGILDGWKEDSEWTINEEEWEKVNFEDLFTSPEEEGTETPAETESVSDTEMVVETATEAE